MRSLIKFLLCNSSADADLVGRSQSAAVSSSRSSVVFLCSVHGLLLALRPVCLFFLKKKKKSENLLNYFKIRWAQWRSSMSQCFWAVLTHGRPQMELTQSIHFCSDARCRCRRDVPVPQADNHPVPHGKEFDSWRRLGGWGLVWRPEPAVLRTENRPFWRVDAERSQSGSGGDRWAHQYAAAKLNAADA